jgi:fatty acid desaturase
MSVIEGLERRLERFYRSGRETPNLVLMVVVLAVLLRVVAWLVLPPIWKLHAVFNPLEMPFIEYVSNFESYKPSRMAFFDVLSAAVYIPVRDLLGYRGLTLFTLLISCCAVPAFYSAARRLLGERVALYGLILFALYPKQLFLVGRGLPESVSVACIMLSLYWLSKGLDHGTLYSYGVAGIFALLAYLMFVPAVLVGIGVTTFLYVRSVVDEGRYIPSRESVVYATPSAIVGVLYLLFGPVQTLLETGGINKVSLFVTPESYGVMEKTLRYLGYTFFDFWWHTRGFDQEAGIQPTIRSLIDFFGPIAPLYVLGWAAVTGVLTVAVFAGVWKLLWNQRLVGIMIVGMLVIYVGLFNYRNIGWAGAFQTRHVFPLFPFLCLAFGVGAALLSDRTQSSLVGRGLRRRAPMADNSVTQSAVVTAILVMLLLGLVINGGVQGAVRAEKIAEERQEPIKRLDTFVEDNESVGVVRNRAYHDVLIYTDGKIRPVLLYDGTPPEGKFTTRLAEYRDINTDQLHSFGVDYLYLRVQYAYLDRTLYRVDVDPEFVERITTQGTIVYRNQLPSGPFRTTAMEVLIVRLPD